MTGKPRILSLFGNSFNQFNNTYTLMYELYIAYYFKVGFSDTQVKIWLL